MGFFSRLFGKKKADESLRVGGMEDFMMLIRVYYQSVMAMQMGGDDFISKPVDLSVLTAKIQATLRRAYDFSGKTALLEHAGAVLNLNDSSLSFQGRRIELTRNEFRILQTLMEQKGKIVSRDQLMTRLWQDDCYVEENTLTVNVTRLRKKLEAAGLENFITTKVGSGYIIE